MLPHNVNFVEEAISVSSRFVNICKWLWVENPPSKLGSDLNDRLKIIENMTLPSLRMKRIKP